LAGRRARSKLKPGQPGTRKLVEQYGDRLLCVRYRYDVLKRRRYTTAEIIVDESDWDPMPSATARRERVAVRIEVQEVKLREKVKAAGGRWDPERRVWHLPMEQVLQLGLDGRVAKDKPIAPPDRACAQPEGGV
jgi:uncharacterized protein YqiB (DUF1249 family)